MKPFNLKEALAGKKVITRDGSTIRQILIFNYNIDFPIVALIGDNKNEMVVKSFTKDGKYISQVDSGYDLFMASTKKKLWIGIEKNPIDLTVIPEKRYNTTYAADSKEKLTESIQSLDKWHIVEIEIEE